MIIPIRARVAGKVLSICRRSIVVTAAIVVPSTVIGDCLPRLAANTKVEDIAPVIKAKLVGPRVFGIRSPPIDARLGFVRRK
jgi:hypothetical protein